MSDFGRVRKVVGFTTTCAMNAYHRYQYLSVVSSNLAQTGVLGDTTLFVSDLRKVGSFLRVFRFLPLIKLTVKI